MKDRKDMKEIYELVEEGKGDDNVSYLPLYKGF